MNENNYMNLAIKSAKMAALINEVPIGAVLVDIKKKKILSTRHNEIFAQNNPLRHAEILVIEEACKLKKSRYLIDTALYVTLEPCVMCAAAISEARIKKIYFGAYDEKKGGLDNNIRIFNNRSYFQPEIYGGIQEKKCSQLLSNFFSRKRKYS
tara:strand:- start:55 stop:513 length:459 start_codon:yes stop_codon:yes gene_type:complete